MKKFLRWVIGIIVVLLILVVVAVLSINPIARSLAERRLQEATGMKTELGSVKLGFRNGSLHLADLKLQNPPEFGGGTFLHLADLYLEIDPQAAQSNRLHFYNVRVDLAELNVVEDKNGRKNTDVLTEKAPKVGKKPSGTNAPNAGLEFAGIDHLEISLGKASYKSERYPKRNYERELGVQGRVFQKVLTEKDLEAVGILVMAQIGMGALLEHFAGTGEVSKTNLPSPKNGVVVTNNSSGTNVP